MNGDEITKSGGRGPGVGVVIVVLLLIALGIYVFINREPSYMEDITGTTDEKTMDLKTQGSSDELSDIEQDVLDTDLDNLVDEELNAIETELGNQSPAQE